MCADPVKTRYEHSCYCPSLPKNIFDHSLFLHRVDMISKPRPHGNMACMTYAVARWKFFRNGRLDSSFGMSSYRCWIWKYRFARHGLVDFTLGRSGVVFALPSDRTRIAFGCYLDLLLGIYLSATSCYALNPNTSAWVCFRGKNSFADTSTWSEVSVKTAV